MWRHLSLLAVVGVGLVGLWAYSGARGEDLAGSGTAPTWEYRIVPLAEVVSGEPQGAEEVQAVETKFNELGQYGWELCAQTGTVAIFKRPRSE